MHATVTLIQLADHSKSYCRECGRKVSILVQDTYVCGPCYYVAAMRVCNSIKKLRTLSAQMDDIYTTRKKHAQQGVNLADTQKED